MRMTSAVTRGVAAIVCVIGSGVIAAQVPAAPPGAPAFDPEALRVQMEAFNRKPDTVGTGKYPALKEMVPSLPDHVIYRPTELTKLGNMKLGIVAWGNGGCSPDGAGGRLHLAEIASHGYLVIASGKILSGPGAPERPARGVAPPAAPAAAGGQPPARGIPPPQTKASSLTEAIDWALSENARAGSPYFGHVDPKQIAVSGWSCGGLQALEIAAEPRVRAVVIHNSGMFNRGANPIPGMDVGKEGLKKLHTPVIYVLGGPTDIAYLNGMDDFAKIENVPVMVANLKTAGHGGTFLEDNGGAAASVAVSWLDWQLRGDKQAAKRFIGKECGLCSDPQWSVERKKIDANTR